MDALHLKLGASYRDAAGNVTKMVREFEPTDPDYVQGFRFRGDNGVNYCVDGTIVGRIGMADVHQLGASPLVKEHFGTLEEGVFFRNGIGQVVLIIGTVVPDTRLWRKGFRFVDQRGSMYKANGKVGGLIFGNLDIVERVAHEQVTDEEIDYIHKQANQRIKWMNCADHVRDLCKTLKPVAIGAGIGGTVAAVMASG